MIIWRALKSSCEDWIIANDSRSKVVQRGHDAPPCPGQAAAHHRPQPRRLHATLWQGPLWLQSNNRPGKPQGGFGMHKLQTLAVAQVDLLALHFGD